MTAYPAPMDYKALLAQLVRLVVPARRVALDQLGRLVLPSTCRSLAQAQARGQSQLEPLPSTSFSSLRAAAVEVERARPMQRSRVAGQVAVAGVDASKSSASLISQPPARSLSRLAQPVAQVLRQMAQVAQVRTEATVSSPAPSPISRPMAAEVEVRAIRQWLLVAEAEALRAQVQRPLLDRQPQQRTRPASGVRVSSATRPTATQGQALNGAVVPEARARSHQPTPAMVAAHCSVRQAVAQAQERMQRRQVAQVASVETSSRWLVAAVASVASRAARRLQVELARLAALTFAGQAVAAVARALARALLVPLVALVVSTVAEAAEAAQVRAAVPVEPVAQAGLVWRSSSHGDLMPAAPTFSQNFTPASYGSGVSGAISDTMAGAVSGVNLWGCYFLTMSFGSGGDDNYVVGQSLSIGGVALTRLGHAVAGGGLSSNFFAGPLGNITGTPSMSCSISGGSGGALYGVGAVWQDVDQTTPVSNFSLVVPYSGDPTIFPISPTINVPTGSTYVDLISIPDPIFDGGQILAGSGYQILGGTKRAGFAAGPTPVMSDCPGFNTNLSGTWQMALTDNHTTLSLQLNPVASAVAATYLDPLLFGSGL